VEVSSTDTVLKIRNQHCFLVEISVTGKMKISEGIKEGA
jgi:hypothetical protein